MITIKPIYLNKITLRLLLSILLGCYLSSQFIHAQNIPGSALFLANAKYHLSPTFAGLGNCYELTATGSTGWLGVSNAPRTVAISAHGRLAEKGGMGLMLINDQNGYQTRNIVKLTLAYHITLNDYRNIFLSFAASGIGKSRVVDVAVFDPTDPAVQNLGNGKTTELNAEVGLLLRVGQWYGTVNFANLVPHKESSLLDDQLQFNQQNVIIYTGYKYFTKNKSFAIEPSVMLHYFNTDRRTEGDIDIKAYYYKWDGDDVENKLWVGINMRNQLEDGFKPLSVTPNAGLFHKNLSIGIGYRAFIAEGLLFTPSEFLFSLGYSFGCERRSRCYRFD